MKSKKSRLVLAIVALILVLGVGYATISGVTLSITGNATAKDVDLKVVFDGNNNVSDGTKVTATADDDSTTGTITVTDLELDETVYATYEIKNKDEVNASIAVPTVSGGNDYFDVKVYYDGTEWTAAQTLNSGATATVKVEVKLKSAPVTVAQSSTTISVSFDASVAA